MSEEATIFEQSQNQGGSENTQQATIPTEVADIVGEGKKYKSVEDALRSVPHAQKHIETLESELIKLRDEVSKRKATEELLEELKSGIQQPATAKAEFDPVSIAQTVDAAVSRRLEQTEAARIAATNIGIVVSAFNSHFGEELGPENYKQIAKEAGLTVSELNRLASNSPTAVLKLAGLSTSGVTAPAKSTSSVNTQALSTNQKPSEISSKVEGRSTKDMVDAWKRAGEKIKQSA